MPKVVTKIYIDKIRILITATKRLYIQSFLPFPFDTFQHFQLFPAFLRFDPSLAGWSPVLRDERHVVRCSLLVLLLFLLVGIGLVRFGARARLNRKPRDFRNSMSCDEGANWKDHAHQTTAHDRKVQTHSLTEITIFFYCDIKKKTFAAQARKRKTNF